MAKHSPGPWVFEWGEIEAPNGFVVAKIPRVDDRIRGKERREEYEYWQGNGQLIAAAPELLEALRYAVDNPEFNSGVFDAMARAAIVKAIGDA